MTITVDDIFTADTGAVSTGTTTFTLTLPRGVAAGKTLVVAAGRNDGAAMGIGCTVSDNKNNSYTNDAVSLKQNQGAVRFAHAQVLGALVAGDTITVTWANACSRKFITVWVVSGIDPTLHTGSGNTATQNTDSGVFGTTAAMSTSLTTSVANAIGFSAFYFGSAGNPATAGASWTRDHTAVTTIGTADRAWESQHRIFTTSGSKTADATQAAGTSWCEAAVVFAATATTPPTLAASPSTNVEPGTDVTLTATEAAGSTGLTFTQTGGTAVTLSGTGATRTFTAPITTDGDTLTFTCTDSGGTSSPVTVSVLPAVVKLLRSSAWVPAIFRVI